MADLLAHVLVAYSLCRLLSWRASWLTGEYVTLGMVGALVPDLVKIDLLVSGDVVSRVLGVPFDWQSLQTGGGVLVSVLVGLTLLASGHRRRGGACLALGAVSHLLVDALLLTPGPRAGVQFFWPLSQYRPPGPDLFLSTEPEPTVVAAAFAAGVWLLDRYRFGRDAARNERAE